MSTANGFSCGSAIGLLRGCQYGLGFFLRINYFGATLSSAVPSLNLRRLLTAELKAALSVREVEISQSENCQGQASSLKFLLQVLKVMPF